MIVSVRAGSVKKACIAARRSLNLNLETSKEVLRSGGEDGIYRVTLADGTIVEIALDAYSKSEILEIRQD